MASVAKRYATAIYELAEERQALDEVLSDFAELARLMADSEELAHFFASPVMTIEARYAALQRLFGDRLHPLTMRFLEVLEEKRRSAELPAIIETCLARRRATSGVVKVRVVSARPLRDADIAALRARLARRFGKQITTETEIDPGLLGGFILRIGDQVIDYSIRNHLEALRQRIAGGR